MRIYSSLVFHLTSFSNFPLFKTSFLWYFKEHWMWSFTAASASSLIKCKYFLSQCCCRSLLLYTSVSSLILSCLFRFVSHHQVNHSTPREFHASDKESARKLSSSYLLKYWKIFVWVMNDALTPTPRGWRRDAVNIAHVHRLIPRHFIAFLRSSRPISNW